MLAYYSFISYYGVTSCGFLIGVQNYSSFSIFRKYSQFSIDIKRKWRFTFRSAHCRVGNENSMTLKRSLHYWTLCVVKPPSTGGSPHKAPVAQSFHIIFNASLKMLNNQSRYRAFETHTTTPLSHHSNYLGLKPKITLVCCPFDLFLFYCNLIIYYSAIW